MILRPRQVKLVGAAVEALREHGAALAVAPTGSGKTIMLSAIAGALEPRKACVVAHRDELTDQNKAKFALVNPAWRLSVVNADTKDWSGRAVFAMAQTLHRKTTLAGMPPLDLLIIDEAHHSAAASYRAIVDRAKEVNPGVKVLGMTATPERSDRKGIAEVFGRVADRITLKELIDSGHLVRPLVYVIDVGMSDDLDAIKVGDSSIDDKTAFLLSSEPVLEEIVRNWTLRAAGRKTIAFCSTVAHAESVCSAFSTAGIPSAVIHGEMPPQDRAGVLGGYETGATQVLVNVAVLTEGYDYTPTSCILLLRRESHPSTLMQMIGRGLRIVDPHYHPGVVKTDCIVLDFGRSCLMAGILEPGIDLEGREIAGIGDDEDEEDVAALAGEDEKAAKTALRTLSMAEFDMLADCAFAWVDIAPGISVATGFGSWAVVAEITDGEWVCIGGRSVKTNRSAAIKAVGTRLTCLAAGGDWMSLCETNQHAYKSRKWLTKPATDNQIRYLRGDSDKTGVSRYHASCLLTYQFNRQAIERLTNQSIKTIRSAAMLQSRSA